MTLSPGVALPNGQFLPRINGSRPRTNEYLYDGISVLQPEPGQVVYYPIIDGMAEFKLNVNAYSPEYGRSNGGTVMVHRKIRQQSVPRRRSSSSSVTRLSVGSCWHRAADASAFEDWLVDGEPVDARRWNGLCGWIPASASTTDDCRGRRLLRSHVLGGRRLEVGGVEVIFPGNPGPA